MISRIKIKYNNLIVDGILLAKYNQDIDRFERKIKKIIFFKYKVYKHKTINQEFYLVFIPWKHKLKELAMITGENIIVNENTNYPNDWVVVEKYDSKTYDGGYELYKNSLEIRKFFGYSWIYENNSFLADIFLSNNYECMSTLYKNLNYLLKEEFDEGDA